MGIWICSVWNRPSAVRIGPSLCALSLFRLKLWRKRYSLSTLWLFVSMLQAMLLRCQMYDKCKFWGNRLLQIQRNNVLLGLLSIVVCSKTPWGSLKERAWLVTSFFQNQHSKMFLCTHKTTRDYRDALSSFPCSLWEWDRLLCWHVLYPKPCS